MKSIHKMYFCGFEVKLTFLKCVCRESKKLQDKIDLEF